uniref:G_PROTEIN_RECEP_F1_2 domain-containing protein n=1 Tax=Romanomermis culicivorax TaxID=13658 RepID=A0A915JS38_ROMCU
MRDLEEAIMFLDKFQHDLSVDIQFIASIQYEVAKFFAELNRQHFIAVPMTSTKWRGWLSPLLVAFCSLTYSLPRFFEITADYCTEVTSGELVSYLRSTALRDNKTYWLVYRIIGGSLLYSFVPFLLLLWLTCRLWLEIRRLNPRPSKSYNRSSCRLSLNPHQQQQNRSMSVSLSSHESPERRSSSGVGAPTAANALLDVLTTAAKKHQNGDSKGPIKQAVQKMPLMKRLALDEAGRRASSKSTKSDGTGIVIIEKMNHSMHVIVITKFLVCQLLPTVMDILEMSKTLSDLEKTSWIILIHCSVLLATFNSSCNFFIYYLTSATFKFDSPLV